MAGGPLELLFRTLLILRTVAMMVLVYLALAMLAERYAKRPDSQVRAFFRILAGPLTRPVARMMSAAGPFEPKVMRTAVLIALGLFIAISAAVRGMAEALQP